MAYVEGTNLVVKDSGTKVETTAFPTEFPVDQALNCKTVCGANPKHVPGMTNDVKLTSFENELQQLINRFSVESVSNTPDFILAQYLRDCLYAFDSATKRREHWYGRKTF